MSGDAKISYVCYLKSHGHEPSDMARTVLNQLPPYLQRQVRCMDYHEVCEKYGNSKPAWLNGAPILATYTEPPEVFKGSAAIGQLRKLAAKASQGGGGRGYSTSVAPGRSGVSSGSTSSRGDSSRERSSMSASSAPPPEAIPAAPVGVDGVYASLATDDLYYSVMPNKDNSGRGEGRKGGKSKLAEAAAEWESQRRQQMS